MDIYYIYYIYSYVYVFACFFLQHCFHFQSFCSWRQANSTTAGRQAERQAGILNNELVLVNVSPDKTKDIFLTIIVVLREI